MVPTHVGIPMWHCLLWGVSFRPLGLIVLGLILAGPIVCGMSQAANDWCDRHVDAINEPDRPIPSGAFQDAGDCGSPWRCRRCHFWRGINWGPWGFAATVFGVLAAWAYSAEPLRLKTSGWWGPGLVGLCYEGLPWFTGAAVLSAGAPDWRIILLAGLYALGAHGIMTLNDFKATEGDRQLGINSLPVTLGSERAARLACWIMAVPQAIIIALLICGIDLFLP